MKTVLITGSSSGLGRALALLLHKEGFKVYATMRTPKPLDGIEVLPLDVRDSQSIESCVNTILEREGKIDILINNAGCGTRQNTEFGPDRALHDLMETNFFGLVRCTKAVLPSMRKRRAGHIVNISSIGGLVASPYGEFYNASKFAVEGYTESLSTYLTFHYNIHFTLIEPGPFASEIFKRGFSDRTPSGDPEYEKHYEEYLKGFGEFFKEGLQSAEEVAAVVLECIQSDAPPLRKRTSAWAEKYTELKTASDPTGEKQRQRTLSIFL